MVDEAVVRELLAAVPAGCTWMTPVPATGGEIADFRIAAAGDRVPDLFGRGAQRVGGLLTELYPGLPGSPLWNCCLRVLATGTPEQLATGTPEQLDDPRCVENRAGIVAESSFTIGVSRVLGGLLLWWERVDEPPRRLRHAELLGCLGWAEYDLASGRIDWSPGMFRLFGRDPEQGPPSRSEQVRLMLPADRGIAETAWQTLVGGGTSDVTVRVRVHGEIRHLRVLSEAARDVSGTPVRVDAVVQDVSARVASRTEIASLTDRLRILEATALAEHRRAARLQELIQPVPATPVPLAGLEVLVSYLPAEAATNVGGDWYYAQTLPDGLVVLAIGDVAGHGPQAASGMVHLRFALVAWLSIGIRDPGELLCHLNRLCLQLEITGTALVAIFDPRSRELPWARAGHPPPLLSRGGTVTDLEHPAGLLLGAEPDTGYPIARARLEPGDRVLFFTDGLVERRGLPEGRFAEVREHLLACEARLLHTPSPDDDTCTLAVRVTA